MPQEKTSHIRATVAGWHVCLLQGLSVIEPLAKHVLFSLWHHPQVLTLLIVLLQERLHRRPSVLETTRSEVRLQVHIDGMQVCLQAAELPGRFLLASTSADLAVIGLPDIQQQMLTFDMNQVLHACLRGISTMVMSGQHFLISSFNRDDLVVVLSWRSPAYLHVLACFPGIAVKKPGFMVKHQQTHCASQH